MKRVAAVALSALALTAAPAAAAVRVPLDQVLRLSVRGSAADVVIGNAEIADVNIVDERTIFVIGKREGVTNLVVLDAAGRTIFSDTVSVSAGEGGPGSQVTMVRGAQVQSLNCAPTCVAPRTQAVGSAPPAYAPPAQVAPAAPASAPGVAAPTGAASVGSTSR